MPRYRKIRHSSLASVARKGIRLFHRLRYPTSAPVTYHLPESIDIRLYPEGEIAEFLSLPRLFEWHELQLIARSLKPGMRMVDVGANIGLYSILGSYRVGDRGRIWAFEPSRENYDRLIRNLQLNDCLSVRAIRVALRESPDSLSTLASDPGFGDAYRYLLPETGPGATGANGEVVPATTLDACAAQYGIKEIDLIKIDVEGGEYRVLLGARDTLAANHDVRIVFESEADWCERAGCRQQDAFELLRGAKFQLYAWDAARHDWTRDERKLFRAGMVWASRSGVPVPL